MAMAAVCGSACTVTTALAFPSRPATSGHSASLGLRREFSLKAGRSCYPPRRCRSRGGIVRAGLPVISSVPVVGPLANAIFNPVLLAIMYAAGAFRFYSGFQKTTYADSSASKISMTALWPVLFLASKAYRDNFKKAIS